MGPFTGSMGIVVNAGKRASGVAAQPARKRLVLGTLCRCTPKGLAKIGELGEARSCDLPSFPVLAGYADPPPQAGFAILGFEYLGLAEQGTARAGLRAHGEPARLSPPHQPDRLY